MPVDRRSLLQLAALGSGIGAGLTGPMAATAESKQTAENPLRILVLGGTGFIGPHMVNHALDRGHKLTLFNRGKRNADLFPEVEKLIGDRDGGLDVLKGREWDVVVDNSGYVPRLVRDSATLLEGSVGHYIFVSTTGVYPFDVGGRGQTVTPVRKAQGFDEYGPLQTVEDPESEDVPKYYGQLKVLCEQAVAEIFPGHHTLLRPTFIVGPGDQTDRFTYWPLRISKGGEVLAPGDPRMPVEYIDARDLAAFVSLVAENKINGIFNVAGPEARMSMAEFLYGLRAVTAAAVRFTWVEADFLAQQDINDWEDLPLRIPVPDPAGPAVVSNARAVTAGLSFRPLAVTALDTLNWFATLPAERQANLRIGLSAEQEAELLAAWHARNA
jgi:2'-hydroxyisoflavone reductase